MYRTIFTYFTSPQTAENLAEVSAYLADTQRAHLTGAHSSARITIYGGVPSDFLAQHNQVLREAAKSIERSFEKATASRNLSHEWRHRSVDDTEVLADVIHQARVADLIITSVHDKFDPLRSYYDVPLRLAMDAGRPVLIVPTKIQIKSVGQRITIAWNDSRESARAVFDALPLLRTAVSVEIVAINPTQDSAINPGQDLASALSRHGVNASAMLANAASGSEGDELIAALTLHDSDMLVMGCYGHSRLRETVLGGVTKYVLAHAVVPVLLSH